MNYLRLVERRWHLLPLQTVQKQLLCYLPSTDAYLSGGLQRQLMLAAYFTLWYGLNVGYNIYNKVGSHFCILLLPPLLIVRLCPFFPSRSP